MEFDKERAWGQVASRITDKKKQRRRRRNVALVLLGFVLTGIIWKQGYEIYQQQSVTHDVEYATRIGEVKDTLLSDGSRIVLNGATRVRYPREFAAGHRTVELLEGEAVFEVKKDTERPFVVCQGQSRVEVLGTVFNVNAYDSTMLYVTLKEGAIRFAHGRFEQTLNPGERLSFAKERSKVKVVSLEAKQDLAWTEGTWSFQEITVDMALAQIAASQHMRLVRGDHQRSYPVITLYQPKDQLSVPQLVRLIGQVAKVNVQVKDNNILLD